MQLSVIVFLFLGITFSFACKCQTQSPKEAFCKAHWVSHVKIKLRVSKQPLPAGAIRKGLNNIRYSVEHVKVFKKPANMTQLPNEIYTPSEPPACGLVIDAGKEYLLAGRLEGQGLFTVLCGQVLPDDSTHTAFENVLEWKNVSSDLSQSLSTITC